MAAAGFVGTMLCGACAESEAHALRARAESALERYERIVIFATLDAAVPAAVADSLRRAVAGPATDEVDSAHAIRWLGLLDGVDPRPLPQADPLWALPMEELEADSLVLRAAEHVRASRRRIAAAQDQVRRDVDAFRDLPEPGGTSALVLAQLRGDPEALESLGESLRELAVLLAITSRENDLLRAEFGRQ